MKEQFNPWPFKKKLQLLLELLRRKFYSGGNLHLRALGGNAAKAFYCNWTLSCVFVIFIYHSFQVELSTHAIKPLNIRYSILSVISAS